MAVIKIFQMFVIYCFIGWILESIFHTVWEKKLVNRGFLNGPYIPIYGFGALFVLVILKPFSEHWYIVFPVSIVITTVLEYLTGWAMEKIFKNKWWDYSMLPLNLHGRICLLFSLGWGFLCLALVYIIHPAVVGIIQIPSDVTGKIITSVIFVIILIDLAFTIRATVNLNEVLKRIEYVNVLAKVRQSAQVKQTALADRFNNQMAIITKRFLVLRNQADQLGYIQKRLLRAFPTMKSLNYQESFEFLRNWIFKKRRKFVLPLDKLNSRFDKLVNKPEKESLDETKTENKKEADH